MYENVVDVKNDGSRLEWNWTVILSKLHSVKSYTKFAEHTVTITGWDGCTEASIVSCLLHHGLTFIPRTCKYIEWAIKHRSGIISITFRTQILPNTTHVAKLTLLIQNDRCVYILQKKQGLSVFFSLQYKFHVVCQKKILINYHVSWQK